MKAAVTYDINAPIEVADVTLRDLGPKDVRVRVGASGLCHSDVSVQNGSLEFPRPIILGHEGAGVVEAVGSAVTMVAPGDHVVIAASISCGFCRYCQQGKPAICQNGLPEMFSCKADDRFRASDANGRDLYQFACVGTLAEYTIVPEITAVKIPKDVPFEVAALVGCAVLTGFGSVINRARIEPGASVAVIGCGGIGLNVIQAAKFVGATTVIGIDPQGSKRDLAQEFGATDIIDASAGGVEEAIRDRTDGYGADYVFECVGRGELFRQAWDSCCVDGTVVALGVASHDDVTQLPSQQFATSEKTLMSSLYGTSRPRTDIPLLVELYRQGRIMLDELVTTRYEIGQINEAVDGLLTSQNARGVIVMD